MIKKHKVNLLKFMMPDIPMTNVVRHGIMTTTTLTAWKQFATMTTTLKNMTQTMSNSKKKRVSLLMNRILFTIFMHPKYQAYIETGHPTSSFLLGARVLRKGAGLVQIRSLYS